MDLISKLRSLLLKHPEVVFNRTQIAIMISNVFNNDKTKLLMIAYDSGIVKRICANFSITNKEIDQLIENLRIERKITDYTEAHWTVTVWVKCLNRVVIEKIKQIKNNKNTMNDSAWDNEELLNSSNNLAAALGVSIKPQINSNSGSTPSYVGYTSGMSLSNNQTNNSLKDSYKTDIRLSVLPNSVKPNVSTKQKEIYNDKEYKKFYINPSLNLKDGQIHIPCDIESDCGFTIYGLKRNLICKNQNAAIYALIYNFLTRSSKPNIKDISAHIKESEQPLSSYTKIYRASILILNLIRNNYVSNTLIELSCGGKDKPALTYAVDLINAYAKVFCDIADIKYTQLQIEINPMSHLYVSLAKDEKYKNGIYCEVNTSFTTNARELWYCQNIKYNLTNRHLSYLEKFLHIISPFENFKEGQFEVLKAMLNSDNSSICIMPTGSGKSLIYYLASLLQPLPLLIVAPTEILIKDQIRNLKKFYQIDNVAHLNFLEDVNFRNFEIRNSLNYLTPMTLQNRDLLSSFRGINTGTHKIYVYTSGEAPTQQDECLVKDSSLIYRVVVDEIHCLSNWCHDYRPEYLMLSRFLNKYLSRVKIWGFTATASLTVIEDIQQQLNIKPSDIFSPISFDRYNLHYKFLCVDSKDDMISILRQIASKLLKNNERAIVFTKSDSDAKQIASLINQAVAFSSDDLETYQSFVDNKSKILITSKELGVGIDLPNVSNTIHFGLPLSKYEYVQEIGRAGRADEETTSYVIYLKNSPDNIPVALLNRNTKIEELTSFLLQRKYFNNDYTSIYKALTNGFLVKETLCKQLIKLYKEFTKEHGHKLIFFTWDELESAKCKLYMLYVTGSIYDWYTYSYDNINNGLNILININNAATIGPNALSTVKKKITSYFTAMKSDQFYKEKVSQASTPEEIIKIYTDWYYNKYLYTQKEQFLDLYDFITKNIASSDSDTTDQIAEYFTLPFEKLAYDETYYNDMSINLLINKATKGIGRKQLINIEKINSNRYSYKLDLLIFLGRMKNYNDFNDNRLERLLTYTSKDEVKLIVGAISSIYHYCNIESKLKILKYIEKNKLKLGITLDSFIRLTYYGKLKDVIFYGILAQKVNHLFSETGV